MPVNTQSMLMLNKTTNAKVSKYTHTLYSKRGNDEVQTEIESLKYTGWAFDNSSSPTGRKFEFVKS